MKTILLVEDEVFFQKAISDILTQNGFCIQVVSTWMDFTHTYFSMKNPPDMILFDINLGGTVGGDKLLSTFRKNQGFLGKELKTKLVLVSSLEEEELRNKAFLCGADGYISKSCLKLLGADSFVNKVRSYLS
jgi:CheY-like chemotaxis protein